MWKTRRGVKRTGAGVKWTIMDSNGFILHLKVKNEVYNIQNYHNP